MNLIDFSENDDALDLVNLDHVRSLRMQRFSRLVSVEIVFSDGYEERITVSPERWSVLEGVFFDWVAA